jgi:hypothetical protein
MSLSLAAPASGADSAFLRLLDVTLPQCGCAVVQVEAYFDESGTHGSAPALCVAGYLMTKAQAISLTEAWTAELAKYELPYFHMVDCAHGAEEFEKLTKDERLAVETAMIRFIKDFTTQGIAVSVSENEYKRSGLADTMLGTAYSACASFLLAGISSWLSVNPEVTDVSYFFEAGHKSQREANGLMNFVFTNEKMRAAHRYVSHTFVDKRRSPAIQAADLLAWQYYTDLRRTREGRPRRADCVSLLQHPHSLTHFSKDRLESLIEAMLPFYPPGAAAYLSRLKE